MLAHSNAVHAGAQGGPALALLSDEELLMATRRLVGRTNQVLAELLAHLGEVEARGVHRTRACSSLYAYCVYELRFSEDEACRRVAAARLVRRFPVLLGAVAAGELHLTGLLMLGPHLTDGNVASVLARAKHRTKRELAALVRVLDPLPAVPARIEPLGPAPARVVPPEPSWEAFVASTCPIRELAAGDRPRDWVAGANDAEEPSPEIAVGSLDLAVGSLDPAVGSREAREESVPASLPDAAPARVELAGAHIEQQRFKVQFTASEEYVRLVEEAKALLSHAVPNVTLEELQMRAMRALVAELAKKKYGASARSRAPSDEARAAQVLDERARSESPHAAGTPECAATSSAGQAEPGEQAAGRRLPRQRGRHIPARVRRSVFERDGDRCSYVDGTGARCAETHRLEFHHLIPFAAGGEHTASNLTLRCAAHNALAAEEDFGRAFMQSKQGARGEWG
jgi:5-methylcytosine-specific restriction endonuclease McrA